MKKKAVDSGNLRRYIRELEKWPGERIPTPAELEFLQKKASLTDAEKDKLDSLAEGHLRRARAALDSNAYKQSIIEMTRVVQFRPLDPAPRIELAHIYLQKSLERGYKRSDRKRGVKFAETALILNPTDSRAKLFLQNYRRMHSDFSSIRNRKYILPILLLAGIIGAIALWQRDLPDNSSIEISDTPSELPPEREGPPETRNVDVDIGDFDGNNWEAEIVQAKVGRRNDDSFVQILGKLRASKEYVEAMRLLVRGRDASGGTLFTIPWTVLDENSPVMSPGDSTTFMLFRWLVQPEISVDKLEITPLELELLQEKPNWDLKRPILVWDTPRSENVSIDAEIRRFEVIEAYDRLALTMDLALTNSGMPDIFRLSLDISLGSDLPSLSYHPIKMVDPAMSQGERRVWAVVMGFPLDAVLDNRDVTIRITEAKSQDLYPRPTPNR